MFVQFEWYHGYYSSHIYEAIFLLLKNGGNYGNKILELKEKFVSELEKIDNLQILKISEYHILEKRAALQTFLRV